MDVWIDSAVEPTFEAAPVEDLLLVYLGQTRGSRAPESDGRSPLVDLQDLWDHLGDFA